MDIAMDIALPLAKCALQPLSRLAVQVFEDIWNFEKILALVETESRRLETLNHDIGSNFKDAQPPATVTDWFKRAIDSLEKAKQLINEWRQQQQGGHACMDRLLCKPNLSTKMRKWRAEVGDLIQELGESLPLIQRSRQIALMSTPHKESGTPERGEEEPGSVQCGGVRVETKNIENQFYSLYIDISYRRGSEWFGVAFVLFDEDDREVLKSTMIMSTENPTTQHQAYYHAFIQGLRAANTYGVKKIYVITKSTLLCKQMQGEVKANILNDLHSTACEIAKEFPKFEIHRKAAKEFYIEPKQLCSDLLLQYEYSSKYLSKSSPPHV